MKWKENMSKLSKDQVKHVAKLANLNLTEEEIKKYGIQLSSILEYVKQLEEVDTIGVEPTFNVSGLTNVYHPDEVIPGLTKEEVLANSKEKKNSMFVVKRVIGG